jgi:voltage-gated potassium channel
MVVDFLIAHVLIMYELTTVFLLLGLVIIICGIMIARFDNLPLQESVYFAFITALTVGLGDVVPKSTAARFITIILAFIGVVLVGVIIGVTVHALETASGI